MSKWSKTRLEHKTVSKWSASAWFESTALLMILRALTHLSLNQKVSTKASCCLTRCRCTLNQHTASVCSLFMCAFHPRSDSVEEKISCTTNALLSPLPSKPDPVVANSALTPGRQLSLHCTVARLLGTTLHILLVSISNAFVFNVD